MKILWSALLHRATITKSDNMVIGMWKWIHLEKV